MPASRRAIVPGRLRVQGHRHLPVPRLRLRRDRPVRRGVDRASRLAVRRQAPRARLSHGRTLGHRLRVDGRDGAGATRRGPARGALRPGADRPPLHARESVGSELDGADGAGHRLPRVLSPPRCQRVAPLQLPAAVLSAEDRLHRRREDRERRRDVGECRMGGAARRSGVLSRARREVAAARVVAPARRQPGLPRR